MKKLAVAVAVLAAGFVPALAHGAQIYLDPATGKYPPGVTFGVDVRIDPQGQCVNAAEVDLAYPQNLLQAVAASDGNSIFSLWIKEPTIYQQFGLVSFIGGLPGGYCGRVAGDPSLSNKLATIYFRFPTSTAPIATSTLLAGVKLSFLTTTEAVLNDGAGTLASMKTAGATYLPLVKGSYVPLNTWTSAMQGDTIPPDPFTVGVYHDPSLFGNEWFAVFSTVDKQTGIDHYDVAEVPPNQVTAPQSQWNWVRAVSPYHIKDQTLRSLIAVRAIDAAGNARVEQYAPANAPAKPQPMSLLQLVAIIGVVGFVILQIVLRLI
ncbi:MAG TPA: hypothetical protein VMT99_02480 [Candidatus Paceibacterota bacterium]|nr:hypothetical protein [Candidatus Paceibacterota bacterium]